MKFSHLVIIFCILISITKEHTETLSVFQDGSYNLSWAEDSLANTMTFSIDAATTGWVGIGLSSNGQMDGADLVLCYIDKNSKAICSDRKGVGYTAKKDTELGGTEDLTNISGQIKNGRTNISFTRKMSTGDKNDYEIKKGDSIAMIFSYRTNGNPDTEGDFLQHTVRAGQKVTLYPDSTQTSSTADSYKTLPNTYNHSIKFTNFTIPAERNWYACKKFNVQQLVADVTKKSINTTYHAIAIEPIVDNAERLHHMVLYGCDPSRMDSIPDDYFACSTNMPPACSQVNFAWAPGIGNFILPEEAGMVWGTYDTQFLVLQIHYDNPPMKQATDSSGVNVYFTTNLRTYDSGVMIVGIPTFNINIPAGMPSFQSKFTCPPSCTAGDLGDIKAISFFPHGHKFLRKLNTAIIYPNGTIDNTTFNINNYSFDNQKIYTLDKYLTLPPGFRADTTCTYDTSDSKIAITGGENTSDEMCYNFITYYPRENGKSTCFNGDGLGCMSQVKIIRNTGDNHIHFEIIMLITILILLA